VIAEKQAILLKELGPVGAKRQFEVIRLPKTNSYQSIIGL
jgi:hypothetical protein